MKTYTDTELRQGIDRLPLHLQPSQPHTFTDEEANTLRAKRIAMEKARLAAEAEKERRETLPEVEWILLSENTIAISQIQETMKKSIEVLKELDVLAGIKNAERYREIKSDVAGWVHSEMLKEKEIKKLSAIVPISSMVIPSHLLRVKELLLQPISFDCVHYSDGWQIDETALHDAMNRHRSFAKTARAVARYHAAKHLADFINGLHLGVYSRSGFENEMVMWSPAIAEFIPHEFFVLSPDDQYKS